MLVFILYILLLFCFLFYSVKAERTSRTFHVFIAIVLIVIAGFRYYVGVDYEAYHEMYLGTDDTGYLRIIEPGWRFLYDLLHSIGGTYNLWFIVISSLTIIPIAYGIKQMSPCVVLSWMFFIGSFLYTESFNACRQYVAMAFLFAGTPFLLAKQFVKFLMVICVAMLFHNSARQSQPASATLRKSSEKTLCWSEEIEFFPWSSIDFLSDLGNFPVSDRADVRSLGYILPD